jgi:hypothetical protein
MSESKRIIKFNSGAGAILCSCCSVIVKEGWIDSKWAIEYHKRKNTYPDGLITQEDWDSKEPLYCDACKNKKEPEIL